MPEGQWFEPQRVRVLNPTFLQIGLMACD